MSRSFRSYEGVAYQRGSCGIPMIAEIEPDPSYLCYVCKKHTWTEDAEPLELELQTCRAENCILQRVADLKAAEVNAIASGEVLKRIAAVVIPDLSNATASALMDLKTAYSSLLAIICASAHEVVNAEERRKA